MSTLSATNDAAAGSQFQSVVQATGLDVSRLGAVAQLQLAVAELYVDTPPGAVAAADISGSTTFGANVPYSGAYTFPAGLVLSSAITITGSASSPASTVRYVGGAEGGTASLAYNAPTGGTHNFRIAGSQHFTVAASTFTFGSAGAAFTITGRAATGTNTSSGAVTFSSNSGTGTGAVGGIVFKVPVTTASGTDAQTLTTVLTLSATTVVAATFAGAVRVNGAASLGTAAGTDITIIDGTGFGAGVASLRLNGLTTAAINNQLGTLANAPSAGDPAFWIPISIAGTVRYVPAWA